MDLGKKIAILILLVTIGISAKIIIDREGLFNDNPEIAGQSSSWLYRRNIYIESDSHRISFNQDIPIIINTQELISSGKLQPNCNDIRFLDEDNQTPLQYNIEGKIDEKGGCNSKETKIWLKIPSLQPEGKTIYFLYGNSTAPNLNRGLK